MLVRCDCQLKQLKETPSDVLYRLGELVGISRESFLPRGMASRLVELSVFCILLCFLAL